MSSQAALIPLSAKRTQDAGHDAEPLLSTLSAGSRERSLAVAAVLGSALLFVGLAPFAKRPLPEVWAFIPAYQSALVVIDLITAVLLFGLFGATRSKAVLVLAGGFMFTAFMAVAHALSFPGLLAPAGVIGGGTQTTAWLYFLWHAAFPLVVCAYLVLRRGGTTRVEGSVAAAAAAAVAAALVTAGAFTWLATTGEGLLPEIMSGSEDLPAKYTVASLTCLVCMAAAYALWRRKSRSVLDLWLMVVMWAWVFDIALAAVLNAGRFSLGFYAGRVYGLLAASFVLVVLLLESASLYARLHESRRAERRLARAALARQAERLRILHDIDRAAAADKAPEAIAEAVIQPLRELLGVPRAIVNLFDLQAGEAQWLAAAGRRRRRTGPPVRFSLRFMGDLEALKRGEPQFVDTHAMPPGPDVDALLASGIHAYMVVPMLAGGELIGALSFGGAQADFDEEQLRIAREAALQLAVAIAQARLLERVRRQAQDLEQRVRERTAELQAANRDLEAFSYSVSHDLQSPLRAIDGFSMMLEEDYGPQLDAEGLRRVGVIRGNARRMAQLINDLLKFSQLGRKPLVMAPVGMGALVRDVVRELAAAYPAARVELGSLPASGGDASLLRQVWLNLVGNALKYSARGPQPRVEIGGREEGGEALYWVRDNGAGFDMRYAEKLFKVFQRLHRADEFEGTGVGLAIVQRIVARHGGRIWAEGRPGEGAQFWFALPAGGGERAAP